MAAYCQNKLKIIKYLEPSWNNLKQISEKSKGNVFENKNSMLHRYCTRVKAETLSSRNITCLPCKPNVLSNHNCNFILKRNYCTEEKKARLPQLMEFPEIIWPSFIHSIRNWFLSNLVIRPYFDREFNLQDFVIGSKQALEVVSINLAAGDISSLRGLVASETLEKIQKSISNMSMTQRQELSITKDDVYFSFPYQVGVILDDSTSIQKRFVEITMCYHALRGLKDMLDRGESPPINMGLLPEYRDKMTICNYRFIREFTKGVEPQWIINVVNHFKPSDLLRE